MDSQARDDPHKYRKAAPRFPEGRVSLDTVLSGRGPIEIDIGFGRGRSLFVRAAQAPHHRILGLEVKHKWVVKVDTRVRAENLAVSVFAADAREVLPRLDPAGGVERIFVHFPDPWWKKRHSKRRVVDQGLADQAARLLCPGGELFVQTDVLSRAEAYREVFAAHRAFELVGDTGFVEANPFGELSNREVRAEADGLPVYRVLARRLVGATDPVAG